MALVEPLWCAEIQRPLKAIAAKSDVLSGGDLYATVFENSLMQHHIAFPPDAMGKITYIAPPAHYTLKVCSLRQWVSALVSQQWLCVTLHGLVGIKMGFHANWEKKRVATRTPNTLTGPPPPSYPTSHSSSYTHPMNLRTGFVTSVGFIQHIWSYKEFLDRGSDYTNGWLLEGGESPVVVVPSRAQCCNPCVISKKGSVGVVSSQDLNASGVSQISIEIIASSLTRRSYSLREARFEQCYLCPML
eukprot:Gb_03529 [translate_table: standard]